MEEFCNHPQYRNTCTKNGTQNPNPSLGKIISWLGEIYSSSVFWKWIKLFLLLKRMLFLRTFFLIAKVYNLRHVYGVYDIFLTISILYYSWLHKNNLREVWRGWVTNLFSKYEKILLHNVYQLQNNPQRVNSWINVKFAFISLNQIYCTDSYIIGKRTGNEV